MATIQTSQRSFLTLSAILFASSAAVTVCWCRSMAGMAAMPMSGGATMSMTWMPGDSWPSAGAQFLGMWLVMMMAMMLPSLVPMLSRYRAAVRAQNEARLGWLTLLVGIGYFFVWALLGVASYGVSLAIATLGMRYSDLSRFVSLAAGCLILAAGLLQFSAWKARHLGCCRAAPNCGQVLPPVAGTAWRHGLELGVHCSLCCLGQTVVLLVLGVMDLRAMLAVTVAITFERLAPDGRRAACALGVVGVAAGLYLTTTAIF